ncbi:MAG: hypothetical protein SFY32_16800 [Bacteroidota bacterium]|nr:hypothetical protein [Bacteroidota bacterium]
MEVNIELAKKITEELLAKYHAKGKPYVVFDKEYFKSNEYLEVHPGNILVKKKYNFPEIEM